MHKLSILAGKRALPLIQEQGLRPDLFTMAAGAAGGPKWLVLHGLDQALFFSWLSPRQTPLHLIGASIGAWRSVALALGPQNYAAFCEAYIEQRYENRPSAADVSRESLRIMQHLLGEDGEERLLNHPFYRLVIYTVRCRGCMNSDKPGILGPALSMAALCNALSRKSLEMFFRRVLFHDGRDPLPIKHHAAYTYEPQAFTRENLRPALQASGAIPLVMSGVPDIPGAPAGTYRDGGLMDYHLDVPFHSEGLVLYPHFFPTITPGWFDKALSWRKPRADNMENVVLISPTPAYVATLPHGRIPDRRDFEYFQGRDAERMQTWRGVVRQSAALGDEFLELTHKPALVRERIKPLQTS